MLTNIEMIADYNFWIKFDDWDIQQANALLLGYNPLYFDRSLVTSLSNRDLETSMTEKDIDILVDEYKKMNSLLLNSVETGLLKMRNTPLKYYQWTISKAIPTFKEFKTAIDLKVKSQRNSELGFSLKRKKQLYKIILSVAIKHKFHPDNNKNPSTAKIRDVIHKSGLNIDDNTIRDIVSKSYDIFKDELDPSVFEN
jgi:hypothetical protein